MQKFDQWKSFPNDGFYLMSQANTRLADGNNYQYATKPLSSPGFDPVDIPLLASQSRYGSPPKLLMVFRDTTNTPQPPYHGWAGTLTWQ